MTKEFLEIGKFVGTHGVRGMVRIQPWCDDGAFLTQFGTFYLHSGKEKIKMSKIVPHGNVVLAAVKGIESIEQAEKLRGQTLYIKRDDASLPDGRYFISEIIGAKVFDADSNALLGVLTDVSSTGANDVWHIKSGEKEYLIPAIPDVISEVNTDTDIIKIKPLKGIFDNED